MGDVAQILGVSGVGARGSAANISKPKLRKPKGISRELYNLIGKEGLTTLVPVKKPERFKSKKSSKKASKWEWKRFSNSARRDKVDIKHWVRAAGEYPDYAFAKFNKKIEVIRFTDDEFNKHLNSSSILDQRWPRDHVDLLFDLAYRFDLRWPVIHDRFDLQPHHPLEDMKLRFYTATSKIIASRGERERAPSMKQYAEFKYNWEAETMRRQQLDRAFRRREVEVSEEKALVSELKKVESRLKKLRDKQPHLLELARTAESADGSKNAPSSDPMSGVVLRSAAMKGPLDGRANNSRTMKKIGAIASEFGVPSAPLPTRAVQERLDALRHSILDLIHLQKATEAAEHSVSQRWEHLKQLGRVPIETNPSSTGATASSGTAGESGQAAESAAAPSASDAGAEGAPSTAAAPSSEAPETPTAKEAPVGADETRGRAQQLERVAAQLRAKKRKAGGITEDSKSKRKRSGSRAGK